MDEITKALAGIVTAIIGVAILAVIVSKSANTSGVIQSAASGFGNILTVAISPVTSNGRGTAPAPANLAYAGSANATAGNVASLLGGGAGMVNAFGGMGGYSGGGGGWDNASN